MMRFSSSPRLTAAAGAPARTTLAALLLTAGAASAQVTFAPYTNYGVSPSGPRTAVTTAVGDFNGDGRVDIAAGFNSTNGTSPAQVGVLLGTGGGAFGAPTVYMPGATCWLHNIAEIQAADFNNDGKLDLVMTEGGSGNGCFGDKVTVQLGNGAGAFASPGLVFSTGSSDGHLATGDFNEDGRLDLAIAGRDNFAMFIHLGNGNGTFGAATTIPGYYADAPFVARDLNGDGHTDLAAVVQGQNALRVALGTGTGSFSSPTPYPVTGPHDVGAGDFNEDGIPDLVAMCQGGGTAFLRGTGTGTFAAAQVSAAATTGTSAVAVADFDQDGHLDVATHSASTAQVYVARGDGTGAFGATQAFAVGGGTLPGFWGDLRGADLNGDGRSDLVAGEVQLGGVSVLLNVPPLVPVAIGDLAAVLEDGAVQIRWILHADTPVASRILRRAQGGEAWIAVSGELRAAAGTVRMTWTDETVTPGSAYQYVVEFTTGEAWSRSAVLEIGVGRGLLVLGGAGPNPSRTVSNLNFTIPNSGRAVLTVVDVRGRRVRTLVDANLSAGSRAVGWDGCNDRGGRVSAGVYFAELRCASGAVRRRLVRID